MNNKKRAMIEALKVNLGIVSSAIKSAGIGRTTHYLWMNNDPEYKQAVEEIEEYTIDVVENKLHELIMDKNPIAILFYLKTKAKKRGYIERPETQVSVVNQNNVSQVSIKDLIEKAKQESWSTSSSKDQ